jgi:hypothetical protein
MKFSTLFPHIRPWVLSLATTWPSPWIKSTFAIWEVGHILCLIALAGSAVIVGLRLLGFLLAEEKPSRVWRNIAAVQWTGLIGVVGTGLLIGMANAERLYDSSAFLVKMICLAAGLVMSFGAVRPMAQAEGQVPESAGWMAILAVLIWGLALQIFIKGGLITPGLLHVATAMGLILLLALNGARRLIYLAGVAFIFAMMYFLTHVILRPDDIVRGDPVNIALSALLLLWIVIWVVRAAWIERESMMKTVIGYGGILIWITAAAAGRWIAFA